MAAKRRRDCSEMEHGEEGERLDFTVMMSKSSAFGSKRACLLRLTDASSIGKELPEVSPRATALVHLSMLVRGLAC